MWIDTEVEENDVDEITVQAYDDDAVLGYAYALRAPGDMLAEELRKRGFHDAATIVEDADMAAYIQAVEVEPEARGRGTATELLDQLEGMLEPPVVLDVMTDKSMDRRRWVAFLKRRGFRQVGPMMMVRMSDD